MTTRILSERRTFTSRRMLAKFSSVTIAPSMLMIKVFSRKLGMYCRITRRSVGFTLIVFAVFCWPLFVTAKPADAIGNQTFFAHQKFLSRFRQDSTGFFKRSVVAVFEKIP